jgi:hypothetical protein
MADELEVGQRAVSDEQVAFPDSPVSPAPEFSSGLSEKDFAAFLQHGAKQQAENPE